MRRTVLILGGTHEAAELARRLAAETPHRVISSLAGRTQRPGALSGEVRTGGFGGVDGLRAYLRAEGIERVVDATHPYASQISAHARIACDETGVPRVQLWRPAWTPVAGDRWIEVDSMEVAARHLGSTTGTVFLSSGLEGIGAFAALAEVEFLLRLIEPPRAPVPLRRVAIIIARGPFTERDELRLLEERRIGVLVSKNSGGAATYAKIAAARRLGLPVLMLSRAPPEPGPRVATAAEAFNWIDAPLL